MGIKRLAIVTDCKHVKLPNGDIGTDNPIFQRQMQELANEFEETWICCPFVMANKSNQINSYTNPSIRFLPVPNAGGSSIKDKLRIISTLPYWYKAFKKINAWADVVYQRFPNNINIPGILYFYFKQKKVFASYTGNWSDYKGEPLTYRLQKILLKKVFKGPVGIYFNDYQYSHIFKTFSPSYTRQDWLAEAPYVEAKKLRWQNNTYDTPVFITVGRLSVKKNQQFILECFFILKKQGFKFRLYVAGDGILKESYQSFVKKNDLDDCVFVIGMQNYEETKSLYRKADFLVHASFVEGYVKVPVEGFFYGVIPILNKISIADEIIGNDERGYIFSVKEKDYFIKLIANIMHDKNALPVKIEKGRQYAYERTIELWKNQIIRRLEAYY